jgi:hypothetical protein
MIRCQFCLENFREDYFALHETRCGRRYWVQVCKNAKLTELIQDDQSNEINMLAVRRDTSPNSQPVYAPEDELRILYEIDIDMRLASKAFDLVFLHCWKTRNIESCQEAIAASFLMGIPIGTQHLETPEHDLFYYLFLLAKSIGRWIRGETNINDDDFYGNTVLSYACFTGASCLLEPLFWRGANFDEYTLLQAIESRSFDTVRFCLALGADPNHSEVDWDDDGNSAVTLASASSETSHIVPLLIEYGATVFVRNKREETPLHLAARRADAGLLRILLGKDSSPEFLDALNDALNGRQCSALQLAVESTDFEYGVSEDQVLGFVSTLLDAGAVAHAIADRSSILYDAAESGSQAIVRLLLERGPEPPQKTAWLNETLVQFCYGRRQEVTPVRILVEAGASVDDKRMLKEALRYGSSDVAEFLLKAGAPLHLVANNTIKSIFDAASRDRQYGVDSGALVKCELLRKYLPDERIRKLLNASSSEFHT